MKLLTITPIFSDAHMAALSKRAEHVLVCPQSHLPSLPAGARTRVIPLPLTTILPGFLVSILGSDSSFPQAYRGLNGVLTREAPDVIVVTDFFHWYFWQCLAYARRNPSVRVHLYSETKRLPRNPISSAIMLLFLYQLKNACLGKVFTFSEEGQSFFEKHLPKASVHVLPIPIDTERFIPKPVRFDGMLRILMNARYATYKRHSDLLHALLTVREKGRPFKVTFIGRSDKGRERVASTVRKLGLSDEVTFLQPVSRNSLQDLYGSHDVLVLPSYNEAIGMVIPEAMACGVPTITSDTVGANVYVEDGKTGFVFTTGDVSALATALLRCYTPHILERMGKEARARIENFSIAAMTERFFREL